MWIASISAVLPTSTPFFVPGVPKAQEEREYARLLGCAERSSGFKPVVSRIRRITCRMGGRDCTIEVGAPDPVEGADVVAIIDLGRHLSYGVFTTGNADAPALLVGKRVYTVTAFD